jgi:adenylate kinase
MKVHVFLGPPGSGKGTQSKRLVEKRSLIHLSTGDILRDAVSKGTEIGLRAKALITNGKLVDDDTVNGIVFARLRDEKVDVLFDGYPRTLNQAEALGTFLSSHGMQMGLVVDFEVPESALEGRVVERMLCSNNSCGAIFNLKSKLPLKEGSCDQCGSPLKHRSDDNSETLKTRMVDFDNTFLELRSFYRDKPNYRKVDGLRTPEAIHIQLVQMFQEQA